MISDIGLPGLFTLEKIKEKHGEKDFVRLRLGTSVETTSCTCGCHDYTSDGHRVKRYRDVEYQGLPCILEFKMPKFKCNECNKSYEPTLGHFSENHRMTKRLENKIIDECYKIPFTFVASRYDLDESTVRSIFNDHIKKEGIDWKPVIPNILVIDEISLISKECIIFVEINTDKKARLIDITSDRKRSTLVKYLQKMQYNSPAGRKPETVIMNFNDKYRKGVIKAFGEGHDPGYKIVVHKYYVINKILGAFLESYRIIKNNQKSTMVDKVKKKDEKLFTKELSKLLTKESGKLTKKENAIIESAFSKFPELESLYNCKEKIISMYDEKYREEAMDVYKCWKLALPDKEEFYPFHSLRGLIDEWEDEVFDYFDAGALPIAMVNSLKGKIKETDFFAKGYKFETIKAKLLYNNAGTEKAKYARPAAEIHEKVDPETNIMNLEIVYYESQYASSLERGSGVDIQRLIYSMKTAKHFSDI